MKMRSKQMNENQGQGSEQELSVTEVYHRVFPKQHLFPEHELMRAILDDAVSDFRKYCLNHDAQVKRRFADARTWILKDDADWTFSFVNVCEVLGFAPDYLRQGLLGWQRNMPVKKSPKTIGPRPRENKGGFFQPREK